MILTAASSAPDFSLRTEDGEVFTREQLLGQRTVLVFYPFAFSPVCTEQLQVYERELSEQRAQGVRLYGVSCDSSWAQKAFVEKLGVSIPQLSDFEPKGATCKAFGVLHQGGFAQRALVIIGPDAVIGWSYQAPSPADLPAARMIIGGLKNL